MKTHLIDNIRAKIRKCIEDEYAVRHITQVNNDKLIVFLDSGDIFEIVVRVEVHIEHET